MSTLKTWRSTGQVEACYKTPAITQGTGGTVYHASVVFVEEVQAYEARYYCDCLEFVGRRARYWTRAEAERHANAGIKALAAERLALDTQDDPHA